MNESLTTYFIYLDLIINKIPNKMGNENSSMCGCYDGEKERQLAETNEFGAQKPDQQSLMQKKEQMEKFSQYSYA
jgi:hypothetical protein